MNRSPKRDGDAGVECAVPGNAALEPEATGIGLSNNDFSIEPFFPEKDISSGMPAGLDKKEQRQMMLFASNAYIRLYSQPSASRETPWALALVLHCESFGQYGYVIRC